MQQSLKSDIERYKARLLAKGFNQRPCIDLHKIFAPTMRWGSTIRAILALAALEDMELESLDVSNAYLNGVLPPGETVYMEQPEGFRDEAKWDYVCQLVKGLYGLKQSGRLWYQELGRVLEGIGYVRLTSDPSIYV
ncbi:reverse transcriptase domain-containing protein, partial [Aetokthonos hydrillicola]|uniref:reverse transcriptase domain-containing protein n=1 Tax=Aetokthonos hydrillicola TaxID=1550245 RepID=UPI001ABA5856